MDDLVYCIQSPGLKECCCNTLRVYGSTIKDLSVGTQMVCSSNPSHVITLKQVILKQGIGKIWRANYEGGDDGIVMYEDSSHVPDRAWSPYIKGEVGSGVEFDSGIDVDDVRIHNHQRKEYSMIPPFTDPSRKRKAIDSGLFRKVGLYLSRALPSYFVADVLIPPYDPPPDVVIWGQRAFRYSGVDSTENKHCYVEVFAYTVAPIPGITGNGLEGPTD